MPEPLTVIAVDPGRSKCGVAVVAGVAETEVLHREVVPTHALAATLPHLVTRHNPDAILVGNGTMASDAVKACEAIGLPVEVVDERLTSVEARKRYFAENPPRGLRRLIPTSMQTPDRPIDDYVAVILAERYLLRSPDL